MLHCPAGQPVLLLEPGDGRCSLRVRLTRSGRALLIQVPLQRGQDETGDGHPVRTGVPLGPFPQVKVLIPDVHGHLLTHPLISIPVQVCTDPRMPSNVPLAARVSGVDQAGAFGRHQPTSLKEERCLRCPRTRAGR